MANGNDDLGLLGGLLGLAGQYYLGTSGAADARSAGQAALAAGEQIGKSALERTTFQPYTVTSSLADVGTTPTGGVGVTLSPEELARQKARFGEAEALFTRAAADPTEATQALYEQIRAVQRPEERRELQGLQQSLFTRGRGGITTGEYGTTAEEFAYNKARAEAQDRAALLAREAIQKERVQDLASAIDLMGAGYRPQQEAIDLFGASSVPSQIAGAGRRTGAELASQAERSGLEGMLKGEQLANYLERAALTGAMPIITGGGDSIGDYLFGEDGLFSDLGSFFGYGGDFIDDFISTNAEVNPALNSSAEGGQASVAINPVTGKPYDTSGGTF